MEGGHSLSVTYMYSSLPFLFHPSSKGSTMFFVDTYIGTGN
jgi:hypothetical protein